MTKGHDVNLLNLVEELYAPPIPCIALFSLGLILKIKGYM